MTNTNDKKPQNCYSCPLYDRPLVKPEIPKKVLPSYIWIVGEAPGETEVTLGRPFVGRAGELLRSTLSQIGLNEPIVITNACLCHPEDNKTPSAKAIKQCQYNLDALKQKYPPKFIIALGSTAAKAVGIKIGKVDEMRGKIYNTPYGTCLLTYHPSRILRSKYRLQSLFVIDLKKAIHYIRTSHNNLAVKTQKFNDEVVILTEQDKIIEFLESVPADTLKAIDVETSIPDEHGNWPDWGLNVYHPLNGIYAVAIAWEDKAYSFPVESKLENVKLLKGNSDVVKKALKHMLMKTRNWIAHNCKFELQVLAHHLGVSVEFAHDTQLLAYLIRETLQGFYSLRSLVEIYLPDHQGFKEVRKKDILTYNALDALYTLRLFHSLGRELVELPQRQYILQAEQFLLKTVVPLVTHVEMNGVYIDWNKLLEYKNSVQRVKQIVEEKIAKVTGADNPRTHRFRKAFEEMLLKNNIPVPTTDTGLPDMSKEALKSLLSKATSKELKELILYKLTYTKLDKSLTAYLEKYPTFLNKYTNRVHPTYRIEGTVTGRLASEKPNFQQIPREGLFICPHCYTITDGSKCLICDSNAEEFINIAKLISAPKGHCLISADYSQMEVRILAHITQDETLRNVIKQGIDLHSYTASKIYKIPYEEIVEKKDIDPKIKKMRQFAKSATFGIIYGITAQGLAASTGALVDEAQKMIDKFYETYPKVKAWIDFIHNFVQKNRYVISPIGRVRHFEGPKITPEMLREAQNFPIQSYASDLTLAAAWRIAQLIKEYQGKIVGLVHDSIKIECPLQYLEAVKTTVKEVMTKWIVAQYKLTVPLEVDIEVKLPEEKSETTDQTKILTEVSENKTAKQTVKVRHKELPLFQV